MLPASCAVSLGWLVTGPGRSMEPVKLGPGCTTGALERRHLLLWAAEDGQPPTLLLSLHPSPPPPLCSLCTTASSVVLPRTKEVTEEASYNYV